MSTDTFSGQVAANVSYVAEWLDLGASPAQVAKLIHGDLVAAYEGLEGCEPLYDAVWTAMARMRALRDRTGYSEPLPQLITSSVGL